VLAVPSYTPRPTDQWTGFHIRTKYITSRRNIVKNCSMDLGIRDEQGCYKPYPGFQWGDFLENSNLSLHAHSPQMVYARLRTLRAAESFLRSLTSPQVVTRFPVFYGTRRFTIVFTSACHMPLPRACEILSVSLHPTSLRSILILSSHPKFLRTQNQYSGNWAASFKVNKSNRQVRIWSILCFNQHITTPCSVIR